MTLTRALIVGLLVGLFTVVFGVDSAGAHTHSCGTLSSNLGRERIVVERGDVNCATARGVTRAFDRMPGAVIADGYGCLQGHIPQRFLGTCMSPVNGSRREFEILPIKRG